jgi:transposase-like protein/predicted nucleic acid-binding Zn finger protein
MKSDTNNREERGKEIALNPHVQILRINDHLYKVKSQTTNREYDIISTETGWICTCSDFNFRHAKVGDCKHIHGVEFSLKMREQVRKENAVTIEQLNVSICTYCNSDKIIKRGIRHNDNYDIQRWFCNECKRWFSFNIGFEKMRANPQAVTSAMQLYFTGESLRSIQKFLRLQGIEVSHQAIYKWIKKYVKLMENYLSKITPQVGDTWRADEVWVKVKGNMKYLFALMDDETRFWIAKEVANSKEKHDASSLFRQAKEVTGTKPKVIYTDGLKSYHDAYLKEFFTQKGQRTIHIKNITIQGQKNNNKMERMNGEIRDREKVVRGLKKDDSPLISGLQIYHNYIRPHMSLNGQTPSEKCGIKIEGKNKWITIIQNASVDQN